MIIRRAIPALLASTLCAPALAQQQPPAVASSGATQERESAQGDSQTIVVTHHLVRDLDLLAGKSVLDDDKLQRDVRSQIGDTLAKLPGVSATSFSPGASRPVLRGFSGERIRVLTDGIGSIDVSNTSSDHAVTIDPLTAERIEVLRGPAVLLFGGQAIGGAVNVIDRRIPRSVPKGIHVDIVGGLGSAASERSAGAAADVALGTGGLVIHADGSWRKAGDLRTGGYILAPPLRAEQSARAQEEAGEGHADEAAQAARLAGLRGDIPNSGVSQWTAGAGLALLRDSFEIGASLSIFDSDYGIATRPGAEHHHEISPDAGETAPDDSPVSIRLRQQRFDLRGEYRLASGLFERVQLRIGAADYTHTEFEGEAVGTTFDSTGAEGRLELVQRGVGKWRGASGVQFSRRQFDALGAEAFLPANSTSQFGLFTLQEVSVGKVGLEGALRFEQSRAESAPLGIERSFDLLSAAAGVSLEVAPKARIGANVSRTARAPSAEELFSNGPHVATQAYEVGDPDLAVESSVGGEIYLRIDRRNHALALTAFANRFDDFIFESATGEEQDDLPLFRYHQADATYYGFEAEASATLFHAAGFRFIGDAVADYVRATVRGAGPVPRIPPLRLLAGLEAQSDRLDGRMEVEWVADQDRIAAFETPTEGHRMVNASLAWRPWGKAKEMQFIFSANNLFDVEARRHASFTKDYVPLAGRDIRLSARLDF